MSVAVHRLQQTLAEKTSGIPRPRQEVWFLRGMPVALTLAFFAYIYIGVMPMNDASAITSATATPPSGSPFSE